MSKSQSDSLSLLQTFRKSDLSGKTVLALSTWFGAGLLPGVPGTFGTLGATPLVLGLNMLGMWYSAFGLVIVTGAAIFTAGRSQILLGQNDPSAVVIDEVAGFLLTMFLVPFSWLALALGFSLFRFFDILKPYPIKKVERLQGGFGIVMDDLLAGLYAGAAVRIILFFVK